MRLKHVRLLRWQFAVPGSEAGHPPIGDSVARSSGVARLISITGPGISISVLGALGAVKFFLATVFRGVYTRVNLRKPHLTQTKPKSKPKRVSGLPACFTVPVPCEHNQAPYSTGRLRLRLRLRPWP